MYITLSFGLPWEIN